MNVWVSVDVETTAQAPALGELATIGAVAYRGDTLERVPGWFYERLRPAAVGDDPFTADHYGGDPLDAWEWSGDTRKWWLSMPRRVLDEAVGFGTDRITAHDAAERFEAWVHDLGGEPVFVAHPAGFDWAWVDDLFWRHRSANPFGYRPLCLRALAWATGPCQEWGRDRTDDSDFHTKATVPHHALHDAEAQGTTLVAVLQHLRSRAQGA